MDRDRVNHSPLSEGTANSLTEANTHHARLFRERKAALIAMALEWNVAQASGVCSGLIPPSPRWFAMTQVDLLQFEIIRTIAASLISVAIVLLWLVAITRQ
jgi:hypothetical protein